VKTTVLELFMSPHSHLRDKTVTAKGKRLASEKMPVALLKLSGQIDQKSGRIPNVP